MNVKLLVFISVIAISIISCQKEASFDPDNQPGGSGTTAGKNIIGKWKFIETSAKTKVVGTSGSIKSITISDYTTINNAGTLTIDAANIKATELTYSVNDVAIGYIYESNILIDSIEMPMVMSMPAATASYPYRKITSDSIYLEKGLFTNMATGGSIQTVPSGVKIKFEGNKMIWTINYKNNYTQDINGTTVVRNDELTSTTTFQKL